MSEAEELTTFDTRDGRHYRTRVPRGAYDITVEAIVPLSASPALHENAAAVVRVVGTTARRVAGALLAPERPATALVSPAAMPTPADPLPFGDAP